MVNGKPYMAYIRILWVLWLISLMIHWYSFQAAIKLWTIVNPHFHPIAAAWLPFTSSPMNVGQLMLSHYKSYYIILWSTRQFRSFLLPFLHQSFKSPIFSQWNPLWVNLSSGNLFSVNLPQTSQKLRQRRDPGRWHIGISWSTHMVIVDDNHSQLILWITFNNITVLI